MGGRLDTWTPADPLVRFARFVDGWLDRITRGRWWAWKAMAVALLVGMLLAGPPFGGFQSPRAVVWRYDFANSGPQLFDPHVNLHDATGNLTFRVVPRLIGAAFGFDSQWQFYVMQLVFGVVLLWAVAQIYDEVLRSRVQATLLTVATACTWAGATAWVETRGLFDVVGIALAARDRRDPLLALRVSTQVHRGWPDDIVFLPYLYLLDTLCEPDRVRETVVKRARVRNQEPDDTQTVEVSR